LTGRGDKECEVREDNANKRERVMRNYRRNMMYSDREREPVNMSEVGPRRTGSMRRASICRPGLGRRRPLGAGYWSSHYEATTGRTLIEIQILKKFDVSECLSTCEVFNYHGVVLLRYRCSQFSRSLTDS
jgi:hypothetical protein